LVYQAQFAKRGEEKRMGMRQNRNEEITIVKKSINELAKIYKNTSTL
jgi:hypothetical protein